MDNLTHGLFGLAIGALRRPGRSPEGKLAPTDKAVLLTCVIAAELPDLDTLWPASNDVLGVLMAHRGPTHSLLAAPFVALVAAGMGKLVFRSARMPVLWAWGCLSVVFAHLLADAWTGWGTRLLLPFSDQRITWDWTLVVDPFVTVPMLVAAIWALRRRDQWRRIVLVGAAVATVYVGLRVGVRALLLRQVQAAYAAAERVEVFPSWFSIARWRFVAVMPEQFVAGTVQPFEAPQVQATHARSAEAVPTSALAHPSVREALAWARMPLVRTTVREEGGVRLQVSDLRYHLGGEPTLGFVFELGSDGQIQHAEMVRGGSPSEILKRMRNASGR